MSLNKSITITSKEGHNYTLGFSPFDAVKLPDDIRKPVIDVVIAIEGENQFNNPKTLFTFTHHAKEYLNENDVILYCYCDNKEILRDKKHQHLSPQEYRSLLFQRLFERERNGELLNKPIVLTDSNEEKHFIHLFSNVHNKDTVELIAEHLTDLQNK